MYYKNWFLLFSFCFLSLNNFSQNTFIPDSNFEQALIDLGYDTAPLDNFVPTINISGVINLDVTGKNIADLTGIEDFSALLSLVCADNQLSVLNLSNNINLEEVYCSNNQISTLNINNLTNLVRIWCFLNQIQDLDISQNTKLIALRCDDNNLSSLNLSNNINLVDFTCSENKLTSINVTNNLNLTWFECGNNLISNLDVSKNLILRRLECDNNLLSTIDVTNNLELKVLRCFNNQIETLNLSLNFILTRLDCSNNNLCQLVLNNGNNNTVSEMNFKGNVNLECVVVDNPNGNHSVWEPTGFLNYVESDAACGSLVPVDVLNDFIGTQYTLPVITNGNYFTKSGGQGELLNPGDLISSSQTIYIFNTINCYSNESNFNVIITDSDYYIPKFFTPNNDGSHDTWNVLDNSNSVNNISIYNRHGKLLKFLIPNSSGWDGTVNGKPMHTDSYWYEIILNTNEVLRGYFALKR